eukprot:6362852-Prymnesium_polylepis.1
MARAALAMWRLTLRAGRGRTSRWPASRSVSVPMVADATVWAGIHSAGVGLLHGCCVLTAAGAQQGRYARARAAPAVARA